MWCSNSRRCSAFSAFVLSLSLAVPHVPRVARAADVSPADKATARDAYLAGMDLRAKKDLKGALEKFKVAYALVPSPITALEVGRSLVELGLLVEGNEKLLEASTMPAKANESADAKKARAEARKLADEVVGRIPSVSVKLAGVPEGATVLVTVDGRSVPADALAAPLKLNPGKHLVIGRIEGAEPTEASVTVAEGESKEIALKLTAPAPKPVDEGPAKKGEGGKRDDASLRPSASGTSSWTYVGFGVAGVGLVVGGITGGMAISKGSTLSSGCEGTRCGPAHWGDVDSYNALRTTSFVALAIGVVGVGIGIGGLVSGGGEPAKAAAVTPYVGLGTLGVRGAF